MSISYSDCLSDLLCGEDSNSIFGEVSKECSSDLDSQSPDIEESIAGLIEDERDFVVDFHSITQYLDASTRAEYVAWIIKVQKYYAFQPLTAYLSVNYFDRFLHSRLLPKMNGWPLQLLSVACLSLAAKMEELMVPPLLNLQVEGAKFIFEPRNIQRMELLVLRVLDWRLRTISPFNYLNFFANKIDATGTHTTFITSRAIEIILSNIQEASFLDYRPSCIAAATVLCAANDLPNFSFITAQHADSWCGGLHIDKINGCYRLMRQIVMNNRPRKPPKVLSHLRVMPRTRQGLMGFVQMKGLGVGPSSNKRLIQINEYDPQVLDFRQVSLLTSNLPSVVFKELWGLGTCPGMRVTLPTTGLTVAVIHYV